MAFMTGTKSSGGHKIIWDERSERSDGRMEDNLNVCDGQRCNSSAHTCKCNRGCNETLGSRYMCPVEEKPRRRERMEYAIRNEVFDCPQTTNDPLSGMPIGMAYVPWQQWGDVFTAECALDYGTIFPDLVKPLETGCRGRNWR